MHEVTLTHFLKMKTQGSTGNTELTHTHPASKKWAGLHSRTIRCQGSFPGVAPRDGGWVGSDSASGVSRVLHSFLLAGCQSRTSQSPFCWHCLFIWSHCLSLGLLQVFLSNIPGPRLSPCNLASFQAYSGMSQPVKMFSWWLETVQAFSQSFTTELPASLAVSFYYSFHSMPCLGQTAPSQSPTCIWNVVMSRH